LPRDGTDRLAAALAFPRAVEHLLQTGLELRGRNEGGAISEQGMRTATRKVEAKLERMSERRRRNQANRRLARHLEHEQLSNTNWARLCFHLALGLRS
jgi:hypothetical protein